MSGPKVGNATGKEPYTTSPIVNTTIHILGEATLVCQEARDKYHEALPGEVPEWSPSLFVGHRKVYKDKRHKNVTLGAYASLYERREALIGPFRIHVEAHEDHIKKKDEWEVEDLEKGPSQTHGEGEGGA